jgi:DsbC/DsbD-like thiol-disulfide interchange protein
MNVGRESTLRKGDSASTRPELRRSTAIHDEFSGSCNERGLDLQPMIRLPILSTSPALLAASCLAALLAMTLADIAPANAEATSPWTNSVRSRVRLLAGPQDGKTLRTGVEIDLQDGWKTYWRYPGDSGVPPHFDFSRSENVAAVAVLWPAPRRFTDGGGTSIGYKHNVIFPVHVTPRDATKPVTLRLALDYAVCEKLCVPEQAKVEWLVAGDSTQDARLKATEAQVPAKAKIGDSGPLAVRAIEETTGANGPRIVVEIAAPPAVGTDVFAEGPTPSWALPLPATQPDAADGVRRFAFDIDGVPSGASTKGATLTLTIVAGDRAIEVPARLDR